MKVKRIFITALVILVAYVLQCTVFPVLDIAGTSESSINSSLRHLDL